MYDWTVNESLLGNTLGHSAGILIFGIFLYLLIQDRAAHRLRGAPRRRGLSPVVARGTASTGWTAGAASRWS